ncbi:MULTISPECIES: type I-E CRISPR-associated protein Cas5/CasD [Aerococcus]|uniref:Type I-E CRISPR-associated protein Cas5/CasD n=1 Tax=Aerococcus sanguinicola TaxID=119206 RepID=A0A5N1GMT3_9LACT|nr:MULTISPECIES: type I-E CRISPR-associated protein Cas5/CasD [Aerococcus]KAA9302303.1 type I-E CRISPR-associated protein Cas5/CasD [Aerococcus sanguinicola]MDK6678960.1 type I-E CRISPR-associated protein Cas5/CasD [Aerococcus sp. UMB8608]MDK6686551.1 type I-E CRISPR-associated protein Cas5/CasD [Aerococcus sp. UMB8623]MDK6939619.1 type I-E CRISPR-associated protein Cas5/CasD [Aerococcus sp. UMB8487]OFK17941.1 type I-E CRISPR-associated protein Cas5/CasD [Aerococcus sp. HMSC072A12]
MKSIVLKFAGPLQSWGTQSHFESRHTDLYPSKSGVIGLVAASLGYRRDQTEDIQALNQLDFAVRVDQEGGLRRDYQTAHKYKANGQPDRTYVTNRYYLEDAVFLVALAHSDDAFMAKIIQALKNPYFQPFMGRRSLPLPLDFIVAENDLGAVESLQRVGWQAAPWYQRQHSRVLEAYADAGLVEISKRDQWRKDLVVSFDQKNRHFQTRREVKFQIELPSPVHETEHDAFAELGG